MKKDCEHDFRLLDKQNYQHEDGYTIDFLLFCTKCRIVARKKTLVKGDKE